MLTQTAILLGCSPPAETDFEKHTRECEKDSKKCFDAGVKYSNGSGVDKDTTIAAKFFAKGCNKDMASACFNLGVMYMKGEGVEKNYSKSLDFYRKSCWKGIGQACYGAALAYDYGKGTQRSLEKSKDFYYAACEFGSSKGCEKISSICNGKKYEDC